MSTLTLTTKIQIPADRIIWTPYLTFTQWLPLEEDNGINIIEDDISITLWFDLDSIPIYRQSDLSKQQNILVEKINATIRVQNLDTELANYIKNRDFTRKLNASEKLLQDQYDALGLRIYDLLIHKMNRLIDYARVYKGQYWLFNFPYDPDRLNGFYSSVHSKGQIDNGEFFQFTPGISDTLHIEMIPAERYIAKGDWGNVIEFVQGVESPPLVFELISEAEQLSGNGYAPSALSEAVTALEVALNDFGRLHKRGKLAQVCCHRLGIDTLNNQIKHLGLTGSVSYLLPLILPEEILPLDVLNGCKRAIELRQNIVHNGQRQVEATNLRYLISSIKKCCQILRDYTEDPE